MSKIVICFSSSIGTEANYLRKPVIQIGPSKWMELPQQILCLMQILQLN